MSPHLDSLIPPESGENSMKITLVVLCFLFVAGAAFG